MTHNPIEPFIKDIPPELQPMFKALIIEQRNTREAICKKVEEIKHHCADQSAICGKRFLPRIQAYVMLAVMVGLLVGLGLLEIDAVAGFLK